MYSLLRMYLSSNMGTDYKNIVFAELTSFKGRRVVAFRKNLIEMAELEIKHAKVSAHRLPLMTRMCLLLQ